MKKVRESEIRDLIENLYRKFIYGISIDEYSKKQYVGVNEANVHINVQSTHVELWWYEKKTEIDTETKKMIESFASILEKISYGNLKVIFYNMDKFRDSNIISIYIANAYEVID